MRKAIRIAVIALSVLICGFFLLIYVYSRVEYNRIYKAAYLADRGYAWTLGVWDFLDRDAYVAAYGEPEHVERKLAYGGPYFHLYETYPGLTIVCTEHEMDDGSMSYRVLHVEIWGEQYRFGRKKIGVGSTREEVERAYRKDRKKSERPDPAQPDAWIIAYSGDERRDIVYHFDESGCVDKISIYNTPK